jgi:hypothetical protein
VPLPAELSYSALLTIEAKTNRGARHIMSVSSLDSALRQASDRSLTWAIATMENRSRAEIDRLEASQRVATGPTEPIECRASTLDESFGSAGRANHLDEAKPVLAPPRRLVGSSATPISFLSSFQAFTLRLAVRPQKGAACASLSVPHAARHVHDDGHRRSAHPGGEYRDTRPVAGQSGGGMSEREISGQARTHAGHARHEIGEPQTSSVGIPTKAQRTPARNPGGDRGRQNANLWDFNKASYTPPQATPRQAR